MKYLILLLVCATFVSCKTDTGDAKKDTAGRVTNAALSEVFNSVLQAGLQYGTQSLTGQNGQDAAKSIFENVAVINGPEAIEHIMQAYAGPEVAPIAEVASSQLAKINPQTDADRVLIIQTIGAAVQQVANQQFSK